MTDAFVRDELVTTDVAAAVRGKRLATLDELFIRVLVSGHEGVTLYNRRGTATYSTNHARIGSRSTAPELVREAAGAGTTVSRVATVVRRGASREVLETFVPVVIGRTARTRGVVAIEHDYGPIAATADDAFFPIAGVLEVVLVGLFVVLVPVLSAATASLRRHAADADHRATHDADTDLLNRPGLYTAIRGLPVPRGGSVALLLINLDRFREFNEAIGTAGADRLLVEVAQRLREAAGAAVVARLAGDEFALAVGVAEAKDAVAVAEQACDAIGQPVVVNSVVMRVGATIGIALAPVPVVDPEVLVREAGIALAAARADGERVRIFDASLDAKGAADLALEAAVRAAVEKGELEVWFQPIVRLQTAQVEAVEALIRWRHPTEGILGPERFLDTILRAGLSRPLNRLVLSQSISRWPEWRRLGFDLDVSVNLSMADLLDASLPDDVARLLARHRVPATSLVVEVTETIAMSDSERVRGVIERLRALGVRVAIDDFGSGFSSLAHLRALPVDEIKLDRQFVAAMRDDEGSAAIVRSVAELGGSLGLVVVAEGVETAEQRDQLLRFGYTFAQGFFFARALSADDLRERLGGNDKAGLAA